LSKRREGRTRRGQGLGCKRVREEGREEGRDGGREIGRGDEV
jgi:hypothetical protein